MNPREGEKLMDPSVRQHPHVVSSRRVCHIFRYSSSISRHRVSATGLQMVAGVTESSSQIPGVGKAKTSKMQWEHRGMFRAECS